MTVIDIIKYAFTLFWFTGILSAQIPKLFINEFLTSNAHVNYDPGHGNYSDWIELYNGSSDPININGYYLTDNPNNPQKFRIESELIIDPFGYVILWADGEDHSAHTNFKLSVEGEFIGVFMPDGSVVDTITYLPQMTDISYGRIPDDLNKWVYYEHPTPKFKNHQNGHAGLIISEAPTFSHSSSFFSSPIYLSLASETGSEIRYTLDGSEPNDTSLLYFDPIYLSDRIGDPNYFSEIPTNINSYGSYPRWQPPRGEVFKATVIRARTYHPDKIPSDVITHTYFVNPLINDTYKDIPVISLVTDEKHLFSDSAGIYIPGDRYSGEPRSGNYATNWTRPASIEYFTKNRDSAFNQECDIRIQGGASVTSPQKSLHVIARNKYGFDLIDYPLFQDSESKTDAIKQHKRFILRAWGTVWNQGMVNDPLAQLSYAKSQIDIQDYYPVIVFINGEYWGLHEIREANRTPYYYQEHYGINRENPGVDILFGSANAVGIDEGDTTHWHNMFDFLTNNDISLQENYRYIQKLIDIDNFIDYIGHCVYLGKRDWPGGNEAFWRPRTLKGRWKWIQYDMDLCFGNSEYDMISHVLHGDPNGREPHGILIQLINNDSFKNRFINWFMDRLNSDFKPEILLKLYNNMLNELYPHLDEHKNRWSLTEGNFAQYTSFIRNFISKRPEFTILHLKSFFNVDTLTTVSINRSNDGGRVKINSLVIDDSTAGIVNGAYPWEGFYFKNIPVQLIGIPYAGYTFSHWEGDVKSDSDSILIFLDYNTSVTAVFKPDVLNQSLRINEVLADNKNHNIDEAGDYNDWIELYNSSNDTVLLSVFYLTDDFSNLIKWKFPKSNSRADSIYPQELKLIWCDSEPNEGLYHTNFSLNKEGEQIGLVQITGNDTVLIDSVTFYRQLSNVSYGRSPDGIGRWKYLIPPSPGKINTYKSMAENGDFTTKLYQNFPNPFTAATKVPFFTSGYDRININIFDLNGRLIRNLVNMEKLFGYQEIIFDGKDNDGNNIPSGIYFYQLHVNEIKQYRKMLFIK
jgi:hypothetical protein